MISRAFAETGAAILRAWRLFAYPVEVPEESRGWVRAEQINAVERFGLFVVVANLMNVIILFTMFCLAPVHSPGQLAGVSIWTLLMCIAMAGHCLHWRRSRRRPPAVSLPPGIIGANVRSAGTLGLLWGAFPAFFFADAPPAGQTIIAMVSAGMMGGGAFMLATAPQGAFAYVTAIAGGCFIALLSDPTSVNLFSSLLMAVYWFAIVFSIRNVHANFLNRLMGERLAREQAEVIGLLLKDFEHAASDWLWRTGSDLALTSGAQRFAEASGIAEQDWAVRPIFELAVPGEGREILEGHLDRRESFSDCVVRLLAEPPVYVSLTGKPVLTNGVFSGFQGVAADITQERESADRIAYLAAHDGLTGLGNRATLRAALEEMARTEDARRGECSLLLIDLDRFKLVNDTLGHGAGDQLLVEVARRVRQLVGRSGLVCRLGGDEFAVLLHSNTTPAALLARRIVSEIERPVDIGEARVEVSASIGMRLLAEEHGPVEADAILRRADLALYRAKSQGSGYVVEFDPSMDLAAQERAQLEADLRSAVAQGQLSLLFQPLVSLGDDRIVACEALLRWNHPRFGTIPPDRFIDIAERSGLIVPIGEWIIRSAIASAALLGDEIRVAINVSPIQLRSPNLASVFLQALSAHGVAARRIEVEITESVLLADTNANLDVLRSLRAIGLRVSLDDFGTGYSSFSYLRKFEFDKLKIDKSFVDSLTPEEGSGAIVGSIIALAHALGMSTVAEGVETREQLEKIRALGCDEAQGFYFAQPLRVEAVAALVAAQVGDGARAVA